MRVTIIPSDNTLIIDRRAITLDLSDMAPNLHAVQFNGSAGHIEYNDGTPNQAITALEDFQPWIQRWYAQKVIDDAPPPPPTAEQLAAEAEREAIRVLRAEAKATAMFDAVKAATLTEIDAWVDNNFATLNAAQRRLLKLLTAVAGLYLRERT